MKEKIIEILKNNEVQNLAETIPHLSGFGVIRETYDEVADEILELIDPHKLVEVEYGAKIPQWLLWKFQQKESATSPTVNRQNTP